MDKKKRKEEMEKLKSLSFGEKIEYLWMYYKIWLVAAAAVLMGLYLAVTMYRGMQENVVLNVAIVGGDNQETKKLEEDFKAYGKIEGKHDVVRIHASISADADSMTSKTALTTLIGANAVDVMICPEDIYKEYERQGGFINKQGNSAVIEDNDYLKNIAGVSYDKVFVGVLINAQHKEYAETFVEYLLKQR